MVVSLMKWMPWQPLPSKKYEVRITVHRLIGLQELLQQLQEDSSFSVEIKWKGSKGKALRSLRRASQRRNLTRQELMKQDGIVSWDEDFRCLCKFSPWKDNLFHPWEVSFTVFPGLSEENDTSFPIFPSASLNLADFTVSSNQYNKEISLPLVTTGTSSTISLHVSVALLELRSSAYPTPQRVLSQQRYPSHNKRETATTKDPSNHRLSPIRMDIFRGLSALRPKKSLDEDSSDSRSSDTQLDGSLDSGSFNDADESESDSSFRKTFNYGTIAYTNQAGASSSSEDEDWIYYTDRPTNQRSVYHGDARAAVPVSHPAQKKSKLRYLPWGKRKASSPEYKGEPLLKKYYGEDGGDDIDFDRRQVKQSMSMDRKNTENLVAEQLSEFGKDNFAVGTWEHKEITSRDGLLKLKTQVFFASIDQRSERVAGESACTTLVAVIADWFHTNPKGETPIKSQLDTLIREGSQEWRKLCEQETYAERFPDRHFDLETVIDAKIRPISVIPDKSFVGFFHPEGIEHQQLHLLHGAMSFDSIWDEIRESATRIPPSGGDLVYIISWNDHFFLLKVEPTAYYIIDTLGERLYEGCDQAFILKFDENTVINRIVSETQDADTDDQMVEESSTKHESETSSSSDDDDQKEIEEEPQVCTGKECCREYIKSFLAAIPIRELKEDLKKGLMTSTPIHYRLQIECHYTSHCWNNE